jgi:hypothetical protein
MHRKFPGQVQLDELEVWRVNRIRIALTLHKFPHEVDEMPLDDFDDLMEILWADEQK